MTPEKTQVDRVKAIWDADAESETQFVSHEPALGFEKLGVLAILLNSPQ